MLQPGLWSGQRYEVQASDSARALGSGDLEVLGTPRLLAWCEAQTVAAVADELPAGATSVGARIDLQHLAASPVGASIDVTARLTRVDADGRQLRFDVVATDQQRDAPIARGQVTRAVVDRARFLGGLGER